LAGDGPGVLQAGESDVARVYAEGAGDVGDRLVRGEPGLLDDEVDVIAAPLGLVEGDLLDDEVLVARLERAGDRGDVRGQVRPRLRAGGEEGGGAGAARGAAGAGGAGGVRTVHARGGLGGRGRRRVAAPTLVARHAAHGESRSMRQPPSGSRV